MHGHLPPTITMHNISPLTAENTMGNGLCAVNVIQTRQIMQFLIAFFATSTAIKPRLIQITMAKVAMCIIVQIVCHAIQRETHK